MVNDKLLTISNRVFTKIDQMSQKFVNKGFDCCENCFFWSREIERFSFSVGVWTDFTRVFTKCFQPFPVKEEFYLFHTDLSCQPHSGSAAFAVPMHKTVARLVKKEPQPSRCYRNQAVLFFSMQKRHHVQSLSLKFIFQFFL